MTGFFDAYVMVDWSAAGTPRRGRDSIWYAILLRDGSSQHVADLRNPPTRAQATAELGDTFARLLADGRRILAGFDFPFGFPSGTAARLGLSGQPWRGLWQTLSDSIEDASDNANNRFDVAERLNRDLSGEAFPFWGNVREEKRQFLYRRGRRPHRPDDLAERRLCDRRLRSTQPVWKLAGIGSAGSQALTGIPRVWQLRCDPRLAFAAHLWPFETGLRIDSRPSLVLAEIYPSLVDPEPIPPNPLDAAQVVAIARHLATLDHAEKMAEFFSGDPQLSTAERQSVECEEGWILGAVGP
ncbi:MAG: cobalamin biosynthesis protein CbiG [Pseudomonadota bacterium]